MPRKNPMLYPVQLGNETINVRFRKWKRTADATPCEDLYYDFYLFGKRYRGCTETSNIRVAEVFAEKKVKEKALESPRVEGVGLLIKDGVEESLKSRWSKAYAAPDAPRDNCEKGNRSYQDASSRLRAFARVFGERQLVGMTFEEARNMMRQYFLKRSAAGKSGRTQVNDKLVLSAWCQWLIDMEKVKWTHNPCHKVKTDATTDAEPEPLTDDELKALLPHAKATSLWPVVVLCLGCGVRPAEASRVCWQDVNFAGVTVRVTNRKGKKVRTRTPDMNTWVVSELKAWKESRPGKDADSLFPLNSFSAFDIMADLRSKAGLGEHVTLQSLRVTACNRAIVAGMSMPDYVLQFGHSLGTAQKHYLKWSPTGKRREHMNAATNFTSFAHPADTLVTHAVTQNETDSSKSLSA